MNNKSKFAQIFEIKRPLKKAVSNSLLSVENDEIDIDKKRLFDRNNIYRNSRKNKYMKKGMERNCHEKKTSVKKIAEEYERKIFESHQQPTKELRRSLSDSTKRNNFFVSENSSCCYLVGKQFQPIASYHSSSKDFQDTISKNQNKQMQRKLIRSFVEAENEEEQEIYRKNLVEEINLEVANMKFDGFIDEEENTLTDDEDLTTDSNNKENIENSKFNLLKTDIHEKQYEEMLSDDVFSTQIYDPIPSADFVHKESKSEYFVDDFSESLGDDLENGTIIAEAYNDEGRELILVQIILDRKIINLDSSESIKNAIIESEFVFYENEGNTLSSENVIYENEENERIRDNIYESTDNLNRRKSDANQLEYTNKPGDDEETEYSEILYGTVGVDSNRSTVYSTMSNGSSIIDEDDEGISLQNYDIGSYNNIRRETFCDNQGIVRIERVGYPEKITRTNKEKCPLSRNDSITSTKQLDYIIDELKVTEKKYVEDLGKVVQVYKPYIRKHSPPHLLSYESTVFGNLSKIYKEQIKFLAAIEKCELNPDEITEVFRDFESLFDLYPAYLTNKPKATVSLKVFNKVLKQMQEQYEERLDFSAYLLTPLQRLGKYRLFLENIEKELHKLQLPVKNTQTALDIIKRVMSQGNDYIAIESIENSPISKSDYGSFIIREKFFIIKPRRFESMAFLFSNIIVFAINDGKTSEIFNYADSIKMNDLTIATFEDGTIHLTDYTKGKKKQNTDRYTYVLEAKSEKIRDTWREAIENILWQQLLKAKENSLKSGSTLGNKYRARTKSSGSAIFYVDQPIEDNIHEEN